MLRKLDRYVFREVLTSWVAVTGVLLVILVTQQLAAVLERAADSRFPPEVVVSLIGISSLQNLPLLVPIGLLLGIVLAFGRLYHESEMAAIQACGVGLGRLYVPVMVLSVALAGVLGWLTLDLSPRAAERVQQIRATASREAKVLNLEAGRFISLGGQGGVAYLGGVDPDGTMRDVFVKRTRGDWLEMAVAPRARHHVSEDGATHTFILEDGRLYEGVPGSAEFRITEFRQQGIPLQLGDATIDSRRTDLKPTRTLLGSGNPAEKAELQWRLSQPLMALVLAFLAVPLSKLRPRQGRYARVGYAILAYFSYWMLLTAAQTWTGKGVIPAALGMWWVHALAIGLTTVLLVRR